MAARCLLLRIRQRAGLWSVPPPIPFPVPAQYQGWREEVGRLKATLQKVLAECAAMQEELGRAELEKAILVEKLKAMERQHAEAAPLQAELRERTARGEQDRLLIDRLQAEFRQAVLERAQLHRDLFEAHSAADRLGALLDNPGTPPPLEPN